MERKQKIMMISVICIVICVILAVILVMVIPKPEKQEDPKPWWEQRDKLEFVVEDERSVEKIYSYKAGDNTADMIFNYIEDKNDVRECIPNIYIYFDGILQDCIQNIKYRERYNENQNHYNSIALIRGIGKYRVSIYFYLSKDDAVKMINDVGSVTIDIIISKGIEG